MSLYEQVNGIQTRADFVCFARDLLQNLRETPDDWENKDIEDYLEAIAAWVDDMDGYFLNRGVPVPKQPDWGLLGQILLAAKYYE